MADKSNIQWTEATWNPTTGCTKAKEANRLRAGLEELLRTVLLDKKEQEQFEPHNECLSEVLDGMEFGIRHLLEGEKC